MRAVSALETAETQRLAELTTQLAKTADPLRAALEAVAVLDAARARALCGFDDLQGVVPESGACLDLVGARDPTLLLDAAVDSVVPIDVLAARGGAVVVSGPNGGGKTRSCERSAWRPSDASACPCRRREPRRPISMCSC